MPARWALFDVEDSGMLNFRFKRLEELSVVAHAVDYNVSIKGRRSIVYFLISDFRQVLESFSKASEPTAPTGSDCLDSTWCAASTHWAHDLGKGARISTKQ